MKNYLLFLSENQPEVFSAPSHTGEQPLQNDSNTGNINYSQVWFKAFFYALTNNKTELNSFKKTISAQIHSAAELQNTLSGLKKKLIQNLPFFTQDITEVTNILLEIEEKAAQLQDILLNELLKLKELSENTLLDRESQQLRFLDQLALAIFAIKSDGTPFYANKCAQQILGKGINPEISHDKLSEIYNAFLSGTEEIYPNAETPIIKALAGESSYIDNMEIHQKDKIIPLEVWGSPIVDKDNNVLYAIAVFNDISHRKELEEEIRKNEVFLDSLIENLPHMLFVKDAKELRFIRFNKVGEDLLGYTKADLIGKNDYDFFPKEQADFFISKDREVLETGELTDIPEEIIQTKYKGERILHTKKIPILDLKKRPQYLLGISEDITEQKKAQDELKQRTEDLARSNTDLEQFAYVVSHDLQEPLRTVSSYVQLLQKRYEDKLEKDAIEFIDFAVDGVTRMQNLIQALLQYSRVSTRGQEPTQTDINQILDTVKKNLHEAIQENHATINIGEMPTIKADEAQMIQLFQNLVGNALKFKSERNIVIKIFAKKQDDSWLFSIKDNGIGIPKDSYERIFVIFQRLHSREEYKGTGIGLAICKKIVERHGGRIWAESEEGKGTTFLFTLKDVSTGKK